MSKWVLYLLSFNQTIMGLWWVCVPVLIVIQLHNTSVLKTLTLGPLDRKAWFLGRAMPVMTKDYFLITDFIKKNSHALTTYQFKIGKVVSDWDGKMLVHYSDYELRPLIQLKVEYAKADWIIVFQDVAYAKTLRVQSGKFEYTEVKLPYTIDKKWKIFKRV